LPRIPLIAELTIGAIPPGSNILVEYDPASQWYNASLSIVAGWLRSEGKVTYNAASQSPTRVRSQLNRMGFDPENLERSNRLRIRDWFSAAHGMKSTERFRIESLKVADLSLTLSPYMRTENLGPQPDRLVVFDDLTCLGRFNDEKLWLELELTRDFPVMKQYQFTGLTGIMSGVQSDSFYKRLEADVDGVIDFRIEDRGGEVVNLVRVRSMRDVRFDPRWHPLRLNENFEVTLD